MAKNSNRTILVTGATGKQGGAALRHLRERGFSVRALTRDPDKPNARALVGHGTEVVRGDLDDTASLTRALDGIHAVYSVQNPMESGVDAEVRQGINLADAAKRSRISHFVYSSAAGANLDTGVPFIGSKRRIEDHIRGTGLHYTILRPVYFMENWLGMRGGIQHGSFGLPLSPGTRLQMVAVDDIGALVAMAIEHPGKWQDRTFDLAGDELAMTDIAQAFSRMAGREVRYEQIPWEDFEKQAGPGLTSLFRWLERPESRVDVAAVRGEYANLTNFERWLHSNWSRAFAA